MVAQRASGFTDFGFCTLAVCREEVCHDDEALAVAPLKVVKDDREQRRSCAAVLEHTLAVQRRYSSERSMVISGQLLDHKPFVLGS